MWREFLSSIGIGNAKVDTVLQSKALYPSSTVEGEIVIQGGAAGQEVEAIVLTLAVRYEAEKEDSDFSYHEKEVSRIIIQHPEGISAKKETCIPFEFTLPEDHPVSDGKYETILRTVLQIPQGVDPEDEDIIFVNPPVSTYNTSL
ncbi:hypothetical protein D0469_17110 [Peribacillus saganii]|uniref:Sporulation protein SpoOM n=1 Tax=Peribacillus saganii TaxID=2303992 RepID=A0A372LIY7_9BACI|nr:sporulation protein [Peribacillus saganii]RFU66355.1 hypothetical protein D0469_17110 [Peribacillus saganii]